VTAAVQVLRKVENALIALLTVALVVLAGAQIVARVVFDTGWPDLEAMLRVMVLWLALLGAMVAAREDKHLAIDAVSHYLKGRAAQILRAIAYFAATAISLALAWYSLVLVRGEYESGTLVFAALPAWVAEAIMPVAFAVIALRFARHALRAPRAALPPA